MVEFNVTALSNAACYGSKKAESHRILFQSTGAYAPGSSFR
ncbi:hypothetical protein GBAR_LOCUS19618 [Geodia barretti]|uniref:Uncharacterized protein n=1 Tax=Geodia barretti TaxID=519541 RepID=A0AA35STZ5_GEOBA|nr:hypothetical protein GBAR_LOCUS19618 [Geodia barretti]